MIKILFILLALTVVFGTWATWTIHRAITCHGQCPHDPICQQRCFAKGDCPAAFSLEIQPAVMQ